MTAEGKASFGTSTEPSRRRNFRRLSALYVAATAGALGLTVCFLAALPFYYDYLISTCYGPTLGCELATMSPIAAEPGGAPLFGIVGTAWLHLGLDAAFFAVYAGVAGLILLLKPKDALGSTAALSLVCFAFGNQTYLGWEGAEWLVPAAQTAAIAGFMAFALLFPSGRATRSWLPWVAIGAFLTRNVPDVLPFPAIHVDRWPLALSLLWMVVFYGSLSYSQFTQYREVSAEHGREAIRKVAVGFIGAFATLIAVSLPLVAWPELYGGHLFWLDLAARSAMLWIPLSLGAALLKHRLWGVPPVVRSGFVYAALLVISFAIYLAVVAYLALVFQTESGVFRLIATGVVAVLFSPIKNALDKLSNRIVYGRREDPVSYLVRLGDRLREPFAPERVLESVTTTIREAMRLPHASITIKHRGVETEAAASGVARDAAAARLPLVVGGEELGGLYVMPRAPGEPLSSADGKLLQLFAREAARIVYDLKQSLDIGRLMQELQASRQKLVYAREEERRTIRNNLHDDLAPRLASLALLASAASDLMDRDPSRARKIVSELETDIREAAGDIRAFVNDLRPPALDQYGLLEAVRQQAERWTQLEGANARIVVTSDGKLPPLPAAVEAAAYRIVSEALANVVKHSSATECRVSFEPKEGELHIEIRDDGIGISEDRKPRRGDGSGGVGLTSLRERAEELGGTLRIESPRDGSGGTRIAARLPMSPREEGRGTD
ncbi:sensor histidine kinase [Paenibacillus antri]|uniref:Oxygen sensor histidine kinase NreB n=1 Tax=Paenibacillus antri TaxID=2582848 RepID=A0A5R9GDG4_9BACL|nr:sensor histidine kinase [Paenibacillus antri]TLS52376.1 sensor histidine kinase [Paenibacillus antri]